MSHNIYAKFNSLTVLKWKKMKKDGWMSYCRCDCGKEKWIPHRYLEHGRVKSCGCRINSGISPKVFHSIIKDDLS